jgi:hypothetical protein
MAKKFAAFTEPAVHDSNLRSLPVVPPLKEMKSSCSLRSARVKDKVVVREVAALCV